jgi:Mg2+ and Co2+ transporter CorA
MEGPLYQQADLRDSVFNEINDDSRTCENALDLAALTVLHAVSALIERSSHPDLEIFRIFEEAISVLTEKMTSSLKRFRTTGFRNRFGEDEVKLNSSSIRARHKREDEKAEKENRDNTSALLELRDIEDELLTLDHLFKEQEEQINQMMAIYSGTNNFGSPAASPPPPASVWGQPINSPPDNNSTGTLPSYMTPLTNNGRLFLQEALTRLKSYRIQANDMITRVKTTRQDFDKLLETVQRQAQIDEVRLSRQQADLASAQNRSVMIFTVFTVIFLPLSFFTSLFGMNTQEWGGGNNIRLRTIGVIALPTSALLVLSALFVAWSTTARKALKSISKRGRRAKNRARRWWKTKAAALWKRLGHGGRDERPRTRLGRLERRRRRDAAEVKRQTHRMKREMTVHDFWERHQLDRETKYEIPSRNRKSISLARAKAKARKEEKERRG